MKEFFCEKRFNVDTMQIIEAANNILNEYAQQGFSLTLRQLYYQFVARDQVENTERNYKRLGKIISDARLAGLIDWEAIEDRGRNLRRWNNYEDVIDYISGIHAQYLRDVWATQPIYIEVWVEKEALIGVVEQACSTYRIPHFACKGYNSQSEQWRAAKRFQQENSLGRSVLILHLGDHDPSGIDMTRDNNDRLRMLSRYGAVEIRRLALNFDQVEHYSPPPNPAKLSDTRAGSYVALYGYESWELDALEPKVIAKLINDNVEQEMDLDEYERECAIEKEELVLLRELPNKWNEVEKVLKS